MKNILLGIIAINLTLISAKLVFMDMQTANASSHIQKIAICDMSDDCANVYKVNNVYSISTWDTAQANVRQR